MRPLPWAERSARRLTVPGLVMTMSPAVSPSPRPLSGSLLVTERMRPVASLTASVAEPVTVTETSLWLGGELGEEEFQGGYFRRLCILVVRLPVLERTGVVKDDVQLPPAEKRGVVTSILAGKEHWFALTELARGSLRSDGDQEGRGVCPSGDEVNTRDGTRRMRVVPSGEQHTQAV